MNKSLEKRVEKQLHTLLKAIDPNAEYDATISAQDEVVDIKITGIDLGKFIGFRGKNLYALENILTLMLNAEDEVFKQRRISLDINQYKEKRIEQLQALARRVSERVLEEQSPISLSPMNNVERKVIHMEILTIEGVKSESIGEGRERLVIISPEISATSIISDL